MNKYIAILSMVIGICVFAVAVNIATPCPVLRTTEDSAIRAEYDAPSIHFAGVLSKRKGMAHSPTAAHTSRTYSRANETRTYNRASGSAKVAEVDGPTFGQFSTRKAMEYHTVGHHARTPNLRQVVGKITVNGYVKK
jgi:hypothetical protein